MDMDHRIREELPHNHESPGMSEEGLDGRYKRIGIRTAELRVVVLMDSTWTRPKESLWKQMRSGEGLKQKRGKSSRQSTTE